MKQKNLRLEYTKIKDIVIAILLSIWIIIPLLKMIKCTSLFTVIYEYKFMEIACIIGTCFFAIDIYNKIKKCENKKELLKAMIPIIILGLYLCWTLVSCIFASNKESAFYGTSGRRDGYVTYLIYAGFFLSAFSISSNKIKKILLNLFIIIATLNIYLMLLVKNNTILLNYINYKEIKLGVFYNSNHYGYYLTLASTLACILFITEKNKIIKILYAIAYITLVYNLILNNTLGCYIAVSTTIVIFTIYCIYNKKYRVFSIISILIFIIISCIIQINGKNIVAKNIKGLTNDAKSIINSNKENTNWEKAGSGRAKLWKYGIIIFMQKPILGYGAENLEVEYVKYNINQDRPHNLIIQLATTSGLPGLLLYISGIGLILFRGLKRLKEDDNTYIAVYFTVIAYLISAMFGNSMYYTSPYFFILLGFIMNKKFEKKY